MADDKTTDILKSAILMEKRGQAFYQKVAQQASAEAVKRFFETMAAEEENHIRILSEQFKAYQANKQFNDGQFDDQHEPGIDSQVLSKEIKSEISAADYEAAAIAAAPSAAVRNSPFSFKSLSAFHCLGLWLAVKIIPPWAFSSVTAISVVGVVAKPILITSIPSP